MRKYAKILATHVINQAVARGNYNFATGKIDESAFEFVIGDSHVIARVAALYEGRELIFAAVVEPQVCGDPIIDSHWQLGKCRAWVMGWLEIEFGPFVRKNIRAIVDKSHAVEVTRTCAPLPNGFWLEA